MTDFVCRAAPQQRNRSRQLRTIIAGEILVGACRSGDVLLAAEMMCAGASPCCTAASIHQWTKNNHNHRALAPTRGTTGATPATPRSLALCVGKPVLPHRAQGSWCSTSPTNLALAAANTLNPTVFFPRDVTRRFMNPRAPVFTALCPRSISAHTYWYVLPPLQCLRCTARPATTPLYCTIKLPHEYRHGICHNCGKVAFPLCSRVHFRASPSTSDLYLFCLVNSAVGGWAAVLRDVLMVSLVVAPVVANFLQYHAALKKLTHCNSVHPSMCLSSEKTKQNFFPLSP
eukprot:TRINITY_DN810_c0_g1_i9.p1 TRINITY_DN810_c0_g1~~TRINITY_DN810_c0_g1_i9.p1  ORF type:complete len:287 (+),score=18.27 TRINITY_DN810_c0_g1_i9:912-1772(+)